MAWPNMFESEFKVQGLNFALPVDAVFKAEFKVRTF